MQSTAETEDVDVTVCHSFDTTGIEHYVILQALKFSTPVETSVVWANRVQSESLCNGIFGSV